MKQEILHNLKKRNKKILCCFLSISMALNAAGICGGKLQTGAPVSVQAAEADENGFVIEDNVLISYTGEGGNVVIPDGVTEIGRYAFEDCRGLTSIELPNSVTEIGDSAFYNCRGLTSIELPNSVTEIGDSAFSYCMGLTSIEIPASVTEIGNAVFYFCIGLTRIELPNSVTEIGDSAFYNCRGLTRIELPNSVTEIGDSAFSDCDGLTRIELPNSVTEIGDYVFFDCQGLTRIELPNSVTEIGDSAFDGCSGLTRIELPNSVTEIGDSAFMGCDGLTRIELPNSVTEIGDYVFFACGGLTSIEIPNNVERIGYDAFRNCGSLKATAIPDSVIRLEGPSIYGTNIFDGTSPDFTIYCHENSVAHSYAEENGYRYEIVDADTDVGEAMRKALGGNKETAKGRLTIKKKKIILKKGQKSKIKITSQLNTGVTYRSLNTSIATVNKNGIVTGKKKGKTSIVVTVNGVKKKVKVTVKEKEIIMLSKQMKLSQSKVTIKKGKKLTIQKASGMGKVTFRSLNKKIVSVSVKGLVKARKRGKTAIMIKGKKKTVKLKVMVKR